MSSEEETKERIEEESGENGQTEPTLHLFKAKGIRHPEFWQCVRYIAPSAEKKEWKSKDAVGKFTYFFQGTTCDITQVFFVLNVKRRFHTTARRTVKELNDT